MAPTCSLFAAILLAALSNADCLECHGLAALRESETAGIYIDGAAFARSIHGAMPCVECHADAATVPHRPRPGPVACSRCHGDDRTPIDGFHARSPGPPLGSDLGAFAASVHARSGVVCADCHGETDVRPSSDPRSAVHPARVAATCLRCHGDGGWAAARGIPIRLSADSYAASVHARAVPERDLAVAATCVDCHGAHSVLPRSDGASAVRQANVAATCGRCHEGEAAAYAASAHGRAVARGAHESPTCSDCHGEHGILPSADPRAPTHRLEIAQNLCLGCHDRPALQSKFGLPARRGATYLDSYHGLAVRGRSTAAAVCTDCHGVHGIAGESDPASPIHPSNRVRTCGRCHVDATERFAASEPVHVSYGDHWATALVRSFYRVAIAVALGGMLVWVAALAAPAVRARIASAGPPTPVRFTRTERAQHAVLAVSFVLLAVTGFALAFPGAAWVRALAWLGLDEETRSVAHRVAAVALVAAAAWHVVHLRSRRGRWLLVRLVPRLADVRAAAAHIRHAVGRGPAPRHAHFAYFEKVEYWALVWGTALMTATGVVLWFPERLPRLLTAVAEAVHFYEALLAVGAIVVWHLWFVVFDPEVYPLNPSIFTGRPARGTEAAERTEGENEPPHV